MQLSIIIPTLNEAAAIGATLDAVQKLSTADQAAPEILIVDGGSDDGTIDIVQSRGIQVVRTPQGRGIQLQAGAAAASGDVLWFLHADTRPPPDAAARIDGALQNSGTAGGNFTLCFDGERRAARLLTRMYPHFRKLGLCYGDSGIFCRRSAYDAAGGFRPLPIFEDLDLIKRLKLQGRFIHLPCTITTSSRRFEGRSFAWTFARWTGMQILYWLGVSPYALSRVYAPIRSRNT
jgi:rSAM/selenodomain-associated transferase 2